MPDPALALAVTTADYQLAWPPAVFIQELCALAGVSEPERYLAGVPGPVAAARSTPPDRHRIDFLLRVAFVGDQPALDLDAAVAGDTQGPGTPDPAERTRVFVEALLALAPRLTPPRTPPPYWPERHGNSSPSPGVCAVNGRQRFAHLIRILLDEGFLGRTVPRSCVDDPTDGGELFSAVLLGALGVRALWPLQPDTWTDELFYGLIEVVHDLVARPRERHWHSDMGCGWHYSDYSIHTGRALYRWWINQLLTAAGLDLRLADDGEDTGRLVRTIDPARSDLVSQALTSPDIDARSRVEHAIALFRGREATEHDKRSAVVAVAAVLEQRRALIRAELGRPDEGALFRLANEFAIRHHRRDQHGDYDPAFLDWIFWWYLATIELTDRLLARDALHPPRS
jgi:hypothetical protein